MKTVLQRVSQASVTVQDKIISQIGNGVLALVAIERGDTNADVEAMANKIVELRIFPGRTPLDKSLLEIGGSCLLVSQFTIAGLLKKGRRPSFEQAEDPVMAEERYLQLAATIRKRGIHVETGQFAATMKVALVNEGPVTFLLHSWQGMIR